jgi:hypothetical protein
MTKQSLESSPSISGSTGNEPVNCTACKLDEFLCNLAEGYLPCVSSELCTSSPELEEGFLPTYYSDTSQSAQSRSMSIASKSYLRGKKTVVFHGFQSLQMFRSSTGQGGEDSSIASAEAFPARTSALQETAQDSTANAAECGTTWLGLLAKYSPATHSLKTAQLSFLEDLTGCCATLPRWGLMLDGELYPQPIPALSTSGNASGFWQTPVADDAANRAVGKWNSRGEPKLSAQVMFPTPTVCGNYNRKGLSATSGDGLATVVQAKTYPTATATAYKGWSPNHNRASTDDRLDYTVERESFLPGQPTPPMRLNPDWVEWLMGWPIGHTALKPLATDRLAEWQQQHSLCYPANKEAA